VREVCLVGRNQEKLDALATRLQPIASACIRTFTDIAAGLRSADIVITVSSAAQSIVQPEHIKPGAVVCDVARPRDVSVTVARERNDVLVIEGGVVKVPGEMRSTKLESTEPFSFGFPQGTAYACMSETIALALDRRYENFTLGKEVSVQQVDEITKICDRHGFRLDGYRSFERAVSDEEIERIRKNADAKRRK
jgi:predicted amino acid dehydrogenase